MRAIRSCWLFVPALIGLVGLPVTAHPQGAAFKAARVDGPDTPGKIENGVQIFWRSTALPGDPNVSEADPEAVVRIFDRAARELTTCRVFDVVRAADPSALGVSIYDVSARDPGLIAIAAVYEKREGDPVALLLYFNWDGSLQQRIKLDNQPSIQALEVDAAGNVWALNDFDRVNPAKSVFTEFDDAGSAITRLIVPRRGWSTDEGLSKGGQTSFGLTASGPWAWLPESRTLVAVDAVNGETNIRDTGLPVIEGSSEVHARKAALLPDGELLMDVGWRTQDGFNSASFVWSSHSGWKRTSRSVESQ